MVNRFHSTTIQQLVSEVFTSIESRQVKIITFVSEKFEESFQESGSCRDFCFLLKSQIRLKCSKSVTMSNRLMSRVWKISQLNA